MRNTKLTFITSFAFLLTFTTISNNLQAKKRISGKCSSIVDYAKSHGTKVIFIAASKNQDGGSEKYIFKKTKTKRAFAIARKCFSELAKVSYKKFKQNKFIFTKTPNKHDGIFVEIKLKVKGQDTIITYSAGI